MDLALRAKHTVVKALTMPVTPKRVVTLTDVAARAGCSTATVSFALRHHPKIPVETRARVEAVAAKLGYRPNPRVASLMAHVRGARGQLNREHIAFVWVHTSRDEAARDRFLRTVYHGARDRAEQLGFGLDEFWTNDPGMTDARLENIIRSRGIVGVVLSPVTNAEVVVTLNWNWSHFAAAVIGNVTWTPELHHAGHHHYLGMRTTLLELARLGFRRPAAVIEPKSHERMKRAWEAAFLTHHPSRSIAPKLIRFFAPADAAVASWVRTTRADVLIVAEDALLAAPGLRAACAELGVGFVMLSWTKETPSGTGGIDPLHERVAAQAVDLVVTQLNSNEIGVPDPPRMMLIPGRWVSPAHSSSPHQRSGAELTNARAGG
jgi:LacI family transcriptional regulator